MPNADVTSPQTSAIVSPTPRKGSMRNLHIPSPLKSALVKPQVPPTPLSSTEATNAAEVWDTYVKSSYLTQYTELEALMHSLQVPLQPISKKVCEDEFRSTKGRFSYRDFVVLLERLKTLHAKWLHKLRGKALDDDLLEAFVAVGGGADSHGEVDLAKMREVVGEFHLNVDLDRIIADMDSDGSANIDFGEFASLIRDDQNSRRHSASPGSGDDDDDLDIKGLTTEVGSPSSSHSGPAPPITLSSMLYVDEDDDQSLLFPPLGLTSRKDLGDLSSRRRMTTSDVLMTHRKKSMLSLRAEEGNTSGTPSARAAAGAAVTAGGALKKPQGKLAPLGGGKAPLHPTRTQLAQNPSKVGGGATAYYKGGGGLRNLTPQPTTSKNTGEGGGQSKDAHARTPSPARGAARSAAKKHKFAN